MALVQTKPMMLDGTDDRTAADARTYGVVMLLACLVFAITVVSFVTRPGPDGSIAVLVRPDGGEAQLMQTLASADAVLVRQSRFDWLAIAMPRNATDQSGFRQALHAAGALALLHPAVLAGCFNDYPSTQADTGADQRA